MLPVDLIATKRDGRELTADQIAAFIRGVTDESIPDYQLAAMAMAVFLNGMTTVETSSLTRCMLASGARLEWPDDGILRVDKHSTGGVGDKTSLILAPLLAELGFQVPMLSGRGLAPPEGRSISWNRSPAFALIFRSLKSSSFHNLWAALSRVPPGNWLPPIAGCMRFAM